MYLNTLDVTLTPRTDEDLYNVQINAATLEILSMILEFKVAASWHISRFLTGKDQSKYVYTKLRRMWKAKLLESFKVYSGSLSGVPLFYMLSKHGLRVLEQHNAYRAEQLRSYPQAKTLLSWGLFKHEAQVVELASIEVKNKSVNFNIAFKGEISSQSLDSMNDKKIEALTPDYTALYTVAQTEHCIYTEFERTAKSKEAMLRKIERYINYLDAEERKQKTLRLIFQTQGMEQSFWTNVLSNSPVALQKLRILTTNLHLIQDHTQFLEPIYLSDRTIKLKSNGQQKVDTSQRIKLFSFL